MYIHCTIKKELVNTAANEMATRFVLNDVHLTCNSHTSRQTPVLLEVAPWSSVLLSEDLMESAAGLLRQLYT